MPKKHKTKWTIFFAGGLLVFAALSVKSQQPTATPAATPVTANTPSIGETNGQTILEQRRRQESFDRLRQSENAGNVSRFVLGGVRREIQELYRKTNKKELKTLAVNSDDAKRFESFLKQNKSGLVKLISDLGCSENQNVIVVTEDCLKYSMPGGGSSYSFRVRDYRIPRLADLTFTENSFQVTGKLLHGILAGIGNVPLEEVSLQSLGMKFLVDFQPVTQYEDAALLDKELSIGVTKDSFIYRRALNALDNMTYILRSVAYDGELYRAVNGVTYNELDFDKRRDVIIAFRIVNREPDKSITILWKELESKDSPKIKRKSEDKKQIKERNFTAKMN